MATTRKHVPCGVDDCPENSHHTAKGYRGYCAKHAYRLSKYGDPTGGRTAQGVPMKHLLAYLEAPDQTDDCVIWPYARNSAGYGHLKTSDGYKLVHRKVCEKFHGLPPEGKPYAAHSCGHGHLGCMNERHLRWASPAENSHEAGEHGTRIRGEATHMAKLTEEMVRDIRARSACGESQSCLASAFNVTQSNISYVLRGATWRHVA